jgi:hypothetical protein
VAPAPLQTPSHLPFSLWHLFLSKPLLTSLHLPSISSGGTATAAASSSAGQGGKAGRGRGMAAGASNASGGDKGRGRGRGRGQGGCGTITPFSLLCRVGQTRIYSPYMTVCSVISLPKTLYIHRIYMVLANPTPVLLLQTHCLWLRGPLLLRLRMGVWQGYVLKNKSGCLRCMMDTVCAVWGNRGKRVSAARVLLSCYSGRTVCGMRGPMLL